MTNNLLVLINRKKDMSREWESTSNNEKYEKRNYQFQNI